MRTYTFHVTLPQHKGVARKVELPAEATLEWLHYAIQDAYNFDADHLYSFFMSGKAWDESSEYTLPEDTDLWDGSPFRDDDDKDLGDDDDDLFTNATGLPPGLPTGQQMPTPDQLRGMMQMLRSDPQAREQFMQAMSAQTGLPPMMVQMLMGNMESALSGMSDEQMNALLQTGNPFGDDDDEEEYEDEDAAGNVRTTKLAELNLRKGQNFLYLFDYGDEWRFNVKVHAINENGDPDAEYPRLIESVGTAPQQYPDDEGEDEWDDEETAE